MLDLPDLSTTSAKPQSVKPPTGKRGRTKQSKATNLIDYKDDIWHFMTQAGVPFTNNLAERAVPLNLLLRPSKALRLNPTTVEFCPAAYGG